MLKSCVAWKTSSCSRSKNIKRTRLVRYADVGFVLKRRLSVFQRHGYDDSGAYVFYLALCRLHVV